MLGTGGAARAVLLALRSLDAGPVVLQARDMAEATKLAVEFRLEYQPRRFDMPIDSRGLINATPIGMSGVAPITIDILRMPDDGWLLDLVSAPLPTPLASRAAARGLTVIDGLSVLVEQAADSFELLFGAKPPRDRDAALFTTASRMIRIAITGSIGMGKSTVAAMFAEAGIPVFDADAEVRAMQGRGRQAGRLRSRRRFPGTTRGGAVDRDLLGARVLGDRDELAALELIVHPAVMARREAFITEHRDAPALLFDIPLLFETHGEGEFDKVIVVSAPADVQRRRVLERPGMTAAKFDQILARQLPDADKRERADFVIDTERRALPKLAPRWTRSSLASGFKQGDNAAMREIIFDTETTGLSPAGGDRMVEIGCVEMINRVETGRTYHAYFNPERPMPSEAEAVHGLSDTFLSDKPLFADTSRRTCSSSSAMRRWSRTMRPSISAFSIIELQRCSRDPVCLSRMVCTLVLARSRHPGAKHSLDALCTRFGVDRSHRVKHGALLDAQLLAQVYVELTGGRQIGLTLVDDGARPVQPRRTNPRPSARFGHRGRISPSAAERDRHRRFIAALANPLWERFLAPASGDVSASV